MDESVIRTLEAIEARAQEQSSLSRKAEKTDREALITTFTHATLEMEANLRDLIFRAEGAADLLQGLDNQLWVISDIISRTGNFVASQEDQLVCFSSKLQCLPPDTILQMAELWTMLGGNRRQVAQFARHAQLLGNISAYRAKALLVVNTTIHQLRQLRADLAEFRTLVATPGLDNRESISLEAHLRSIKMGVQRLGEFRQRGAEKSVLLLANRILYSNIVIGKTQFCARCLAKSPLKSTQPRVANMYHFRCTST